MAKKDGSQRPVLPLLAGNVLLGYNHVIGVLRSSSVLSGWTVKRAKRVHGPTCTWEKDFEHRERKGNLCGACVARDMGGDALCLTGGGSALALKSCPSPVLVSSKGSLEHCRLGTTETISESI